ncbi:MAG: hypothetical protein Q8K98_08425 [Bacteroidota bacterium]|nr:hypothetical protein [Bacteroidota bacterium]
MKIIFTLITIFLVSININAQDSLATKDDISEVKGTLEGMNETVTEMENFVDIIRKIKWPGCIQAQYLATEGKGISTFAEGNFPADVRDQFQVWHARLKLNGVIECIEKLLAATNDPVVRLKIFTMN